MQMTNGEIVASYRQAKDKGGQVKILAELNACPVQTIKDILIASGVSPQQLPRTRGKNKKGEKDMIRESKPVEEITTDTEAKTIAQVPAVGSNKEDIILKGLVCLREHTENEMARAEEAYNAQMKRYMELLQQVDELIGERAVC